VIRTPEDRIAKCGPFLSINPEYALRQAGQHVSRWRPTRLRGPMAQL